MPTQVHGFQAPNPSFGCTAVLGTKGYHVLYGSHVSQVCYVNTFADYPFADPSQIFHGHVVSHQKTVLYKSEDKDL